MKKLLLGCAIVFAACILFFGIFAAVKTIEGEHIATPYFRFIEKDGGKKKFNWLSLVFPVQIESQKKIGDTVRFIHRVVYPIAPKFKVVEPYDRRADTAIAREIARVIKDSLQSIQYRLWGDLDGHSKRVRNNAEPETLPLSTQSLVLKLIGTASPEAEKYGFIKSIQPGALEPENKTLANNRLSRTRNILMRKLESDKIFPTEKPGLEARELQLTNEEVDSVSGGHKEILDRMRYVEANVSIITERLVITPLTAPILLPIWVAFITLLASSIVFIPRRGSLTKKIAIKGISAMDDPERIDWIQIIIVVLGIVVVLALLWFFWKIILLIGLGLALIILICLIYTFRREIWEAMLWLWKGIKRFWRRYRPRRRECWIVVIALLLSILLNIYQWLF